MKPETVSSPLRSTGFALSALWLLIGGCASHPPQFYPDTYFDEDRVYENKALGFALAYRGNWHITTDPAEMTRSTREFARSLHRSGAELLFVGSTVEATQGTRGIAVNLNMLNEDYAERIRAVNRDDIDEDYGMTETIAFEIPVVKWEYTTGGFRFVEFFFTLDTYNIRIAFWTKPALYENFLPVYEEIMATLSRVSRL